MKQQNILKSFLLTKVYAIQEDQKPKCQMWFQTYMDAMLTFRKLSNDKRLENGELKDKYSEIKVYAVNDETNEKMLLASVASND